MRENPRKKPLILSFDLEDFRLLRRRDLGLPPRDALEETKRGLDSFLEILSKLDPQAKLTFFTTGEFAEQGGGILRELSANGHEIACHGHRHERLDTLDEKAFALILETAKAALEDTIGKRVIGFRAPSFSLSRSNTWAFTCLRRAGFEYDSSLVETSVRASGSEMINTEAGPIEEFPLYRLSPPLFPSIRAIGGTYFRFLPTAGVFTLLERTAENGYLPHVWLHASDFYARYFPASFSEVSGLSAKRALTWPFEQFSFRFGVPSVAGKLERVLKVHKLSGPIGGLLAAGRVASTSSANS